MFEQLNGVLSQYEQLGHRLCEPSVLNDAAVYTATMKEYKTLEPLAEAYRAYQKAVQDAAEAKALTEDSNGDEELHALAEEEWKDAEARMACLRDELRVLLLPKDPNDDKNVILEIRAGAGGEEAALFAAVLARMYTMHATARGWTTERVGANETELGGFREISMTISGEGAYSQLKYESGVHRVQRVPETETQGRIHTSTVTVAVLPEAEEVEVEIDPADLQIDTYRSSGAGGQHVNKTESAIRITHKPSGIVVECQDERSQYKNKDKAMRVLRARLFEQARAQQETQIAGERRAQVGTGDRSERIRTYNYPQSRVTDHRIGLTLYRLEAVLNGDLKELTDALITADRAAALANSEGPNEI